VTRAYWDLYFQRSALLQRYRNYQRALEIYRQLEGRADFDTVASQLARARAAVLARKVDVRLLQTRVMNAETRIRELVRDHSIGVLGDENSIELVPTQLPLIQRQALGMPDQVNQAMENRPEIEQTLQQIKMANVEMQVAENELLPALGLVLDSYVAGLDGGSGIERAFTQQFGQVKPGYSAGFVMEYPLRNRAAHARYQRRQQQLQQLTSQMDDVVGKVIADVEVADRELKTAYANFQNTIAAVQSANADVEYVYERWKNFAFIEDVNVMTPNTLLEQLLDAQQRQSDAEVSFSTAVRNFMVAEANLRLAVGTILATQSMPGIFANPLDTPDERPLENQSAIPPATN
jgi:outer membrane protein TolC